MRIKMSYIYTFVDHNKLWKILKEMGISDHFTYFLMKVKEESEKTGLKLNIKKRKKIMASDPTTSWQIDGDKIESDRLCFLGLQNHCRW